MFDSNEFVDHCKRPYFFDILATVFCSASSHYIIPKHDRSCCGMKWILQLEM